MYSFNMLRECPCEMYVRGVWRAPECTLTQQLGVVSKDIFLTIQIRDWNTNEAPIVNLEGMNGFLTSFQQVLHLDLFHLLSSFSVPYV